MGAIPTRNVLWSQFRSRQLARGRQATKARYEGEKNMRSNHTRSQTRNRKAKQRIKHGSGSVLANAWGKSAQHVRSLVRAPILAREIKKPGKPIPPTKATPPRIETPKTPRIRKPKKSVPPVKATPPRIDKPKVPTIKKPDSPNPPAPPRVPTVGKSKGTNKHGGRSQIRVRAYTRTNGAGVKGHRRSG